MINIEEVKANCKERRVLYASDLTELCIKNKWHISDACIEYAGMLNSRRGKSISTDNIITIAMDIYQHSNVSEDSFNYILLALGKACTTFFEY